MSLAVRVLAQASSTKPSSVRGATAGNRHTLNFHLHRRSVLGEVVLGIATVLAARPSMAAAPAEDEEAKKAAAREAARKIGEERKEAQRRAALSGDRMGRFIR